MIVMFCDKSVGLVVVQRQLPWRISIQSANDIDDDGAGDDDCGDNDDDHEIVEKYKVITKKWNDAASPAPPTVEHSSKQGQYVGQSGKI